MITAHVNTEEFRKGLTAVKPHIPTGEDWLDLSGARLTFTDVEVLVSATNRFTAAIASASVMDSAGLTGDPETDTFQLPAVGVTEILSLFKPAKTPVEEMGSTLRIDIEPTGKLHTIAGDVSTIARMIEAPDPELKQALKDALGVEEGGTPEKRPEEPEPESPATVTFTDVTGLWPGKVYEIPAAPHSRPLAQLPTIFRKALDKGPTTPGDLNLSGQLLKYFAQSAAAYEGRLTLQPTHEDKVLLVTIGEQFVGLLMPVRIDPESDEAAALESVRSTWTDTLTGM
ncbi:hypothetical protein [Brevibacterium sp.]|uniref:hypothetical protein n=1 Tax=Brevibacterium sp. TaxID=1701 RepID=UPI002811923C|nr:hypothetical protein [Brevibacterium sp.]